MNDNLRDHLISAYHDGELSASERAEVDQLLAASAEARAELDSYRKLSSLLREAGRPTLDSSLAPVVMQTIEQRMRLPETAPRPLSKSGSTKGWTKWAAAIATMAAAVIIAVNLLPKAGNDPVVARTPTPPNQVTPQPEITLPAPKKTQPIDTNTVAKVEPTTPGKTPDNQTAVAPQLSAADFPIETIQDLKKSYPGKVVRFMKTSEKDVAVFHLMVLDVQPGLESLQMILSAQQISGPKNQPKQSGVVAIYVQANQDQLDKVIAELMSKDQEQFVALAVQKPVKAEEVQKLVNGKPENAESSQMPVEQTELAKLGVNDVQERLVATGGKGSGRLPVVTEAMGGNSKPIRKLLIVVEKIPSELMPKSTPQN